MQRCVYSYAVIVLPPAALTTSCKHLQNEQLVEQKQSLLFLCSGAPTLCSAMLLCHVPAEAGGREEPLHAALTARTTDGGMWMQMGRH